MLGTSAKNREGSGAIFVDDIAGSQRVVVKELDRLFSNIHYFSGNTILADGRVALALDIPELLDRHTP